MGTQAASSSARSKGDEAAAVADVTIVGSGMVGAALAALLAANPLSRSMRILLVDQQAPSFQWQRPPVPELRVSTITPATIDCLERAGAWAEVEAHSAQFSAMQVGDTASSACLRWSAVGAGRAKMGAVAENSLLQAALLAALKRSAVARGLGPHLPLEDAATPPVLPDPAERTPGGAGAPRLVPAVAPGALAQLRQGVTCLWPATLSELHLPPGAAAAMAAEEATSGAGTAAAAVHGLAELVFEGGARVRSRLVVAADGANSRVRTLAGLRTWGWPYHQRGLVATVQLKGSAGTDTAWQRFLPTGPLALLPVRDGLANIVWSCPPAMAAQLEALGPEAFAATVNQALGAPPSATWGLPGGPPATAGSGDGSGALPPFGQWLPPGPLRQLADQAREGAGRLAGAAGAGVAQALAALASAPGAIAGAAGLPVQDACQVPPKVVAWVGGVPRSFPLQLKQSGRYVRPRLALIGDAAHVVHPMAGQGVNLGFGDAMVLADTLVHAAECGVDPGDLILLQDLYERPRQRSVLAMTSALEALHRVFALQAQPFAVARSLGLGLLNAVPPVKNQIMSFALQSGAW